MPRTNLVFAVILFMVIPVLAQDDKNTGTSESECSTRFKASDVNNDNVLTVPLNCRKLRNCHHHLRRRAS